MYRFRYIVYHIICLHAREKRKSLKKIAMQRRMKMKIFMSRINNQKRVNNAQIATDKDGKIVFVRMSLMRKAS